MNRNEAIQKLMELKDQDLVPLARKYDVTIWKDGKKNKGWAGHVLVVAPPLHGRSHAHWS